MGQTPDHDYSLLACSEVVSRSHSGPNVVTALILIGFDREIPHCLIRDSGGTHLNHKAHCTSQTPDSIVSGRKCFHVSLHACVPPLSGVLPNKFRQRDNLLQQHGLLAIAHGPAHVGADAIAFAMLLWIDLEERLEQNAMRAVTHGMRECVKYFPSAPCGTTTAASQMWVAC